MTKPDAKDPTVRAALDKVRRLSTELKAQLLAAIAEDEATAAADAAAIGPAGICPQCQSSLTVLRVLQTSVDPLAAHFRCTACSYLWLREKSIKVTVAAG